MLTGRDAALKALRVLRQGGNFRAETRKCEDIRERALAENIAMSAARNLTLIDWHITRVSSVSLKKIEPAALDILRVAVCQLMFLDKIPASAAVNEAVKAAKRHTSKAAPFVNGVLRRLTREGFPEVTAEDYRQLMAVKYSHPAWYVDALCGEYGVEAAEAALSANNTAPPVYCAANLLRTDVEALAKSLSVEGADVRRLEAPGHILAVNNPGELTKYTAFRNGWFYVQDPGAYHIAEACGAKPGDTVFDMCAAPGGKTFALANIMGDAGKITAFDTPGRVDLIKEGVSRLGITSVDVRAGDASLYNDGLLDGAEVVLVDAPCSGFGVIRKKPEIRFRTPKDISGMPEIQYGMLDRAAAYVKRGGRLVYATCTLLAAENCGVADRFMQSHGGSYAEIKRETILPSTDNDGFYIFAAERVR